MNPSAKLRSHLDDPDELLGELQGALAALADIELRYDLARERLGACGDSEEFQLPLDNLEADRERERATLVDKLQYLQRTLLDQIGRE